MHLKSHSQKQEQTRNSPSAVTPPSPLKRSHKLVTLTRAWLPSGTDFHSQFNFCASIVLTVRLLWPWRWLWSFRWRWQMRRLVEQQLARWCMRVCSLGFPPLPFPGPRGLTVPASRRPTAGPPCPPARAAAAAAAAAAAVPPATRRAARDLTQRPRAAPARVRAANLPTTPALR